MAGVSVPKVAQIKGAQPTDYDYVAQLVKNAQQLELSGQSATQDVPGLMTSPGNVTPGNAYDSFRLPARVDPAQVLEAQHELARVNALQGAASFVPATVFGVKHGRAAGAPAGGGGPVWDAVREQTTAPLRAAQMDVDQQNQANDLINKIVGMNAGARSSDRALAGQLATAQGAAQVAGQERATQQKEFGQSQATTRRGQDTTLAAAQLKLGMQNRKTSAIADAADDAINKYIALIGYDPQTLQPLSKGDTSSSFSMDVGDHRLGSAAGMSTANIIGTASNMCGQVLEQRGLRGKQQDELNREFASGIRDPEVGLATALLYRTHIQKLRTQGPVADPVAAPAPGGDDAGDFDPTQPIGGGQ